MRMRSERETMQRARGRRGREKALRVRGRSTDINSIKIFLQTCLPISWIHGHHHTGRADKSKNVLSLIGALRIFWRFEKSRSSDSTNAMERNSCWRRRKIKHRPGSKQGKEGGEVKGTIERTDERRTK